MQNKKTLLIFPLITQLIFSCVSIFVDGFSVEMVQIVLMTTTIPAFLFALICVKFNYHQQHLVPLAFFSGIIGFFYSLFLIISDINRENNPMLESHIEYSFMVILFALAYSCVAMMYALLILRPFLRKRLTP